MTKKTFCWLLAASLGTLPGWTQEPGARQESLTGVVRKNLAPVSDEILRVKLPRPVDRKLKNGLPVMVLEDHRLPTVYLDLVIPASTLSDPADIPGIADATADMIRLGTKTRSAREIVETLAELGASINTSAGFGSRTTHIYVSSLTENMDSVLELMTDILLNPSFPQDEFDKWKTRQLSGLQQARTQPSFLASERLHLVLYPGDARSVIAPTPASLGKMTRQHLIDYHKSFYRPSNSLLGVAGDVRVKEIAAKLDKYLGAWESGTAKEPALPLREPIAEKKVYLIHRPNSVQTSLTLANRAIDRLNPDYIACRVMNKVLGEGPAARLFRNIREDKGYTYGISSSFTAQKYLNHFSTGTSVRTEVTEQAVDEILKEFRDIRERAVPADELQNAKRSLVASFALSLESPSNVLRQVMLLREYGLPDDYWDVYPEKVMAVTAEEVQRVARKYVPVDNLQLVVVGDAEKIRKLLAKYGPVEEYSAEGEKVGAGAAR